MKSSELKLGDLVKARYGNILKIVGIGQASCSVLNNEKYTISDIYSNDLFPIPLTEEILEKNGFIHYKDNEDDFWHIPEECFGLDVIDGSLQYLKKKIKSVHDLQHILWALGMDDNLKI